MIKFCIKFYGKGKKKRKLHNFSHIDRNLFPEKNPVPLGSWEIVFNLCFHYLPYICILLSHSTAVTLMNLTGSESICTHW